MTNYNKFNSRRRAIRIDSEVAQTPTLPLNKEGILQSSSASWSPGFHMYIYTVSIISKRTEGCLYKLVLSECLRENLLLPIRLYYRWNTSMPGHRSWMRKCVRPSTTCSSHLSMGYSHTWLRTWTSKWARQSTTCSSHLSMGYSHTWLRT